MVGMNKEFLQAIFGEDWQKSHVTSFTDDPSNIPQDRRGMCWKGRYAGDQPLDAGNQYFTISRFKSMGGRAVRRKLQFIACHVIVADDVREKLPIAQIRQLPQPSYKLLTSSESEQWGWILTAPCFERKKVDNLLDGLVRLGLAPNGVDPGMRGVTRYVRLPDGYNSKANRLINNQPFNCELLEFSPWWTVTMGELAEPFAVDLLENRVESRIDGASSVSDHPLLDSGIAIKNELSAGRFNISCPWLEDHTGLDDSGTAVWTNEDLSIGFKCHHGHCQDRTAKDLIDWIEDEHPGWSYRLDDWKVYKELGADKNFNSIPDREDQSVAVVENQQSILEKMLDDFRRIPPNDAKNHVYGILKLSDKLEQWEKMRVYAEIKDYMNWNDKNFNLVLNEQKKLWKIGYGSNRIQVIKPLSKWNFPSIRQDESIRGSIENVQHLMEGYGITSYYNQITKATHIDVNGLDGYVDGVSTMAMNKIISLAIDNDMATDKIPEFVKSIAYLNPVNPVVEHLQQLPCGDGHITALAQCLVVEDGTEHIRDRVFRMFMVGACAAADWASNTPLKGAMPKFEYVMTLVSDQGVQKTKFFRKMLPVELQRYFKEGQFLDPSDKDSVLKNIMNWVNELGELDGIFRRADISRMKAFLSESDDVLRQPYGRVAERFSRRTIFVASVNEHEFLKDQTGNRRYWPLFVEKIHLPTRLDVVDLAWGEAWTAYNGGEQWWPTVEFERVLDFHRVRYQASITDEPVEDAIRAMIRLKAGVFVKDVLTISEIRQGLNSSGIMGHELQKIPSHNILGKIMKNHGLGVSVRTGTFRCWIIRNFDKYENMKPAELSRVYK